MICTTKNFSTKNGFTLLEVIIYIGLISVVLVAIVNFNLEIFKSSNKIQSVVGVQNEAQLAIETIAREIKKAQSINLSNSVFASDSGVLALNKLNGAVAVFDLDNGSLRFNSDNNTNNVFNLTSPLITVTKLRFTNLTASGTKGTVKVELDISRKNPDNQVELQSAVSFVTTVNLRENNL